MKKLLLGTLTSVFLFAFTQAVLCDGYLPTEKGKKFTFNQYDGNKKILGYLISEVTESKAIGNKVVSKVNQTFKDANDQETKVGKTEYRCENGSVFLDIKNMIPKDALNAIEGMQGISIVIDADEMEVPIKSKKGDKLNDVSIKITAKNNGFPIMSANADVTNIVCQGKESVKTSAGTFDCLTISNDVNADSGYMKLAAKSKQWLAKGIGVVKVVNYDDAGSVVSIMELQSIE